MTELKIQEMLELLRDPGQPVPRADLIEALSDLARIKGAALSVPEIEREHQDAGIAFGNWCTRGKKAHEHRATLLDALRAVTAERDSWRDESKGFVWAVLCNMTNQKDFQEFAFEQLGEAAADHAKTRAQLAQAQKEIERLTQEVAAAREDCSWSNGCHWNARSDLAAQLAQAERDKAAMREGLRSLHKLVAKLARPPLSSEQLPLIAEALRILDALNQSTDAFAVAESGAFDPQPGLALPPGKFMMGDGSVVDTRDVEAEKGQESKAESERDSYRYFTDAQVRNLILEPGERAPAGSLVVVNDDGDVLPAKQYNATLAAHRDVKTGDA